MEPKTFRRSRSMLVGAALAAALWQNAATAKSLQEYGLSFRGFGSVGALFHSEEGIEYRRHVGQPEGAREDEIDFRSNSLIGGQVNASLAPQLEAVLQGISRYHVDGSWTPRLSRGFLRYSPLPELQLRGGRMGLEIIPQSDSRDVGYANVQTHPPIEFFGVLPRDYIDGIDAQWTQPVGSGLASVLLFAGRMEGETRPLAIDYEGEVWGGHLEYSVSDWLFRVGLGRYLREEPLPLQRLVFALRQANTPDSNRLAERFSQENRHIDYQTAVLTYAGSGPQARLCFGRLAAGEPGPRLYVGSLLVSQRLDRFTPYTGYSFIQPLGDTLPSGVSDPQLDALARRVQRGSEQETLTLGLRWDFAPGMDLKFQVDHVWLEGTDLVIDRNRPPRNDNAEMTVYGVTWDFVF